MRLKLKENPREWRNFAFLCSALFLVLTAVFYFRGFLPGPVAFSLVTLAALSLVTAALHPRLFRPLYRCMMRVSFRIGQTLGKVILGAVYLFVVTPLGLLLRLTGKDLLELKRSPHKSTYWKPAKPAGRLEDLF
jgi:hypothetical protein